MMVTDSTVFPNREGDVVAMTIRGCGWVSFNLSSGARQSLPVLSRPLSGLSGRNASFFG